jgi:hypothetical protein
MIHKLLSDVLDVHPAAQDCVPAAILPAIYNQSDIVKVDLKNGASLKVLLHHVDMPAGDFKGKVIDGEVGEVRPGDLISFNYR